MATPHVAGVAALLYAQGRDVADVETALLSTARQPVLGVRGQYSPVYGYGIVDAEAAVATPVTAAAPATGGTTDDGSTAKGGNGKGGKKPR
jgi:hypothetical protein